jgi:hypothetical protein
MRHVTWFLAAVENFRFLDLRIYPMADPEAAAAEIRADALIKTTGRAYRQEYVVFLRCKAGKITHLREYAGNYGALFAPSSQTQIMARPILRVLGISVAWRARGTGLPLSTSALTYSDARSAT